MGTQLTLDFIDYPRLGSGDRAALESTSAKHYDGILFVPFRPRDLADVMRRIVAQGTPMLCVASDAPDSGRIGSVTVDAYTSGALAAELLSHKLQAPSRVATITGELATFDHAEKLRGFAASLAMLAPHHTLLPVVESHENRKTPTGRPWLCCGARLAPTPSTSAPRTACPCCAPSKRTSFSAACRSSPPTSIMSSCSLLESGKVLATLYQRPEAQGKVAFETLIGHLMDKDKLVRTHRFAPHIILRSNLSLFVHRLTTPSAMAAS